MCCKCHPRCCVSDSGQRHFPILYTSRTTPPPPSPVFCFQTIDLPQHLAQGPLLQNHDHPSVKTKEPLQAAYRIIHRTIHQGQSILQSSIIGILDSLRNRSRDHQQRPQLPQGTSPFWDRHLGQWASIRGSGAGFPQRSKGRCHPMEKASWRPIQVQPDHQAILRRHSIYR